MKATQLKENDMFDQDGHIWTVISSVKPKKYDIPGLIKNDKNLQGLSDATVEDLQNLIHTVIARNANGAVRTFNFGVNVDITVF